MTKLILGAAAGAVGGLAMKAAVRIVDPDAFGLSTETDAKTAHEVWRRMGWEPTDEKRAALIGGGMHYAFAAGAGAAYMSAAGHFPALRAGRGTAFGAALWLVGDEIAVTAAGLEDPRRVPMFSHVSALGAHLLYGLIVELISSKFATRGE